MDPPTHNELRVHADAEKQCDSGRTSSREDSSNNDHETSLRVRLPSDGFDSAQDDDRQDQNGDFQVYDVVEVWKIPITEFHPDDDDGGAGTGLLYGLMDRPPAVVVAFLGVQGCFMVLLHCIVAVEVLSPYLCFLPDSTARADLLCKFAFMAGLATLLNNSPYGLRLGMVQAPCVSSIAAVILSVMEEDIEDSKQCPSDADRFAMGAERLEELWHPRAQKMQATVLISAVLSAALGVLGLPRLMSRCQTPQFASIASGLSVLPLVMYTINLASRSWAAAIPVCLAVVVCGFVLRRLKLPVLVCSVRDGSIGSRFMPTATLLAMLIPIVTGWVICAIMTSTEVLLPQNESGTSIWREHAIHAKGFISFPWPVPWGWPSLQGASWVCIACSVCIAVITNLTVNYSTFYSASAAISGGAELPAMDGCQRGALFNAVAGFLGALWGAPGLAGGGQEAAGAASLTHASSLLAARVSGVLLLILSLSPVLLAMLANIPHPLLAGAMLTCLGSSAGHSIKYLGMTDMKSPRNYAILGVSVILGLCVAGRFGFPAVVAESRLESVDQVAGAVVAASPLTGLSLCVILDAILPRTRPQPNSQSPTV